jgi:hypothetical protein
MLGRVATGATPLASVAFIVNGLFPLAEEELEALLSLEEIGLEVTPLSLGVSPLQEESKNVAAKTKANLFGAFMAYLLSF